MDGLTPEFYKHFWPKLKPLYLKMINATYQKGELPYTLRKALLALLFKKGDEKMLKNYRPISLTNCDYKILCFVLANRLQKVLSDLIHEDQTGYIKGRYIGSNARLISDYFDHCESFQIPGILLFLDFEKAFDSIEWNFMFSVLKKFNFGEGFIKWVQVLYNKPTLAIKNNGWISKDITLERGVRQGCPLSALLFVLSVEVMAINIRNNKNIHGFNCLDSEIKTSMYADDTTLLMNDLDSVKNAIENVNIFSNIAGPRLNVDKTEGILLGPLKNSMESKHGINFTNEPVRCLGIYIGHNIQKCKEKNWDEKLEKIKIVFERWKYRNLSLPGKVLIIKSLASAKLVHNMTILHTPEEVIKEIEKLIFGFLWDSHDRIKRKTLIAKYKEGGINMLDIICKNKALKASWLRFMHHNNVNSLFLDMYLKKAGITRDFLFKSNITDPKLLRNLLKIPVFWSEVFAFANECKTLKNLENLNASDYLSEPLWLNNRFKIKGNPIFLSNWVKSQILYVKDIFNENGDLINANVLQRVLVNKTNWISELYQVKTALKSYKDFNTSMAKFINIKSNWNILHNKAFHNVKDKKSKFYYDILVGKKVVRNYMEDKWENEFHIEKSQWSQIYTENIWKIKERKIAEFRYKLITNILCTRSIISKWNNNVTKYCTFCRGIHSVRHLLYECPRVYNLWIFIGTILKVNITYKHIIIGNIGNSETIENRNLVILYITYAIYKFWVLAENKKADYKHSITQFVKNDLFKRTLYNKDKLFTMMCDSILKNM